MTSLVNVSKESADVYIGRPSIFGNPYTIGKDGDRKQVIEKYRSWFYNKLKNDWFHTKVLELKDKKLGCWCSPLECHGNVIIDYLEGKEIKHDTKKVDFTDFGAE